MPQILNRSCYQFFSKEKTSDFKKAYKGMHITQLKVGKAWKVYSYDLVNCNSYLTRCCPKLCRLLSETVGLPNKQHDIATKRNFSIPSKFNRIQQFISSNIESDDFWELMFYMRCCTVWSWYLCEALHNSIMTSYLAPELQICDKICFSKHVRSCNLTE